MLPYLHRLQLPCILAASWQESPLLASLHSFSLASYPASARMPFFTWRCDHVTVLINPPALPHCFQSEDLSPASPASLRPQTYCVALCSLRTRGLCTGGASPPPSAALLLSSRLSRNTSSSGNYCLTSLRKLSPTSCGLLVPHLPSTSPSWHVYVCQIR